MIGRPEPLGRGARCSIVEDDEIARSFDRQGDHSSFSCLEALQPRYRGGWVQLHLEPGRLSCDPAADVNRRPR
ncbi:MAG TPA: hypothetical protein VF017_10020 [Thermoanaerobaculia bacterium]|nr:hypothetical protein [Thermoanaerobaculia bacterium]